MTQPKVRPATVPHGYCHCGCGEKTKSAAYNNARLGVVKGQPQRFINGHVTKNLPFKHGRVGYKRGCRCDLCLRACQEHTRKWGQRHPDRLAASRRKASLKNRYGLTLAQYDELVERHEGCCAVCRRKKKLCIDHCHATGTIRGLLCIRCNLSIGRFNDDADVLRRASEYLAQGGFDGIRPERRTKTIRTVAS